MRIGPHHHPCQRCGAKTECCGDIEQNYDGAPEWTCVEFHEANGGINIDFICPSCYELPPDDEDGPWGGGFAPNH